MVSPKIASTPKAKKSAKRKTSTVPMATGGPPLPPRTIGIQQSRANPTSYQRISSIKNPRYGDALRVHGQDLLQVGLFGTSSNTMILNVPIDLATFAGTRLEQFSKLYEKFLFRKLTFKIVSGSASTVAGSYLMAYDRDASDPTPPNSITGLKALASYENAKEFKIWEDGQIVCPLIQPDDGYYTNSGTDERLFTQGQFYLMTVFGASLSNQNFALWVEYQLDLFVPQLEQEFIANLANANTAATPNAVTDWFATLGLTRNAGSSNVNLGYAPNGLRGILLNAGEYAASYILNSASTSNVSGITAGLGTLVPILQAVVNGETPQLQTATSVSSAINNGSTGTVVASRTFSINSPPGGCWVTLPGAGDGLAQVVTGLILNLFITKGQSFYPF